jgi:hypothetical protein
MTLNFTSLVPFIQEKLSLHHSLYSAPCKSELWEELCSKALIDTSLGSDWLPDFNHKVGTDQTTACGVRISNKAGSISEDGLTISGSRLTKHKTLKEKLLFITQKSEDYIFSLATDKAEWARGQKRYYFSVIDSKIFNFYEDLWGEVYGEKGAHKGSLVGWFTETEKYSAKICRSMSDQLWLTVKLDACEEVHEINI